MSSENLSLIAADDAAPKQLELVPSTELGDAFFEREEATGNFTAARLFLKKPETYKAIVSLVAEKVVVRSIARALRVSHNTIRAVCAREGLAIDTIRGAVVDEFKFLERLAVDRLIDNIDAIKLEALPMAIGIIRDKINALEGTPTTIVGHVVTQAPIDEINDYIASLPAVAGDVVEIGVGSGNVSAMADLAGDLGAGLGSMDGDQALADGDRKEAARD